MTPLFLLPSALSSSPKSRADRSAEAARLARRLIGAPFVHGARAGIRGVDCIGLVLYAGMQAGAVSRMDGAPLLLHDTLAYARGAGNDALRAALTTHLQPLAEKEEPRAGDVLLFEIAGAERHVGLTGDVTNASRFTLIHAYESAGGVREHQADTPWRRRIRGAFRFVFSPLACAAPSKNPETEQTDVTVL